MRLGHGFDETAADGPSDHEEGVIKDRAAGNEQRLTRGVLLAVGATLASTARFGRARVVRTARMCKPRNAGGFVPHRCCRSPAAV
jgi:hypothetical protein